MQQNHEVTPAPGRAPRWPWWLAVVLCLAGIAISIELERIHFSVHTNPAFRSFCGIDRTVNCDIVARSQYSVFLGVSWASWGIIGYLVAGVIAVWGAASRRRGVVAGYGLYLGLAFLATSAVLGAISVFLIKAACPLCMGSYAINLVFLLCMAIAARPITSALAEPFRAMRAHPWRSLLLGGVAAAAVLTLALAHPSYWSQQRQAPRTRPATPTLPTGIEPGGGHFIGAEKPALTVVEFSDYECPFCRQAHAQIRALLDRFPNQLRLVHRHYPLDKSCNSSLTTPMHLNACFAAMVAECAGEQNRFWQANDYLFAEARGLHARSNTEIARDLGLDVAAFEACLRQQGPRTVAIDVDEGNRLGIQGTPTFFIAGKSYVGQLPAWLPSRLQAALEGKDGGGP
jgi:protein-disulfide isomerase